jgi:hypothetical protein
MEGLWFRTIAARKNSHASALVTQGTGKFLDDGSFAGSADGQISDGDDLHAKGRISQDANIVKEPTRFDDDPVNPGQHLQASSNELGAFALPLFEDDFQDKSFSIFEPDPKRFTHPVLVCQSEIVRASGSACGMSYFWETSIAEKRFSKLFNGSSFFGFSACRR